MTEPEKKRRPSLSGILPSNVAVRALVPYATCVCIEGLSAAEKSGPIGLAPCARCPNRLRC